MQEGKLKSAQTKFTLILGYSAHHFIKKKTPPWNKYFSSSLPTLEMAFVRRPVILRQMLAANEDEAGGNSPITVFKPVITSTDTYGKRKVMFTYMCPEN